MGKILTVGAYRFRQFSLILNTLFVFKIYQQPMSKNIGNEWWTSPTESIETGNLIMVTGRRGVEPLRNSGKYGIRVEITWPYASDKSGMPDKPTSMIMEAVHEAMLDAFKKDPVAVMTGVYTGDGRRDWVFYARNTHTFEKRFNVALASFDLLPISIHAEPDPDWEEYDEMCQASEIVPEE
ncbi:DUF695 domain-containing protein [Muribaculum caecicola]|uniref:DUF695 domain-containing protein n=1 Tax=Muribaculum caecicola TaxID=3038144 RepID=A0AC61S4X1_9BACT|nr:DUF695 domain-containing protein [Muribaculum caecicola]